MTKNSVVASRLILLFAVLFFFIITTTDLFYKTGNNWYTTCWQAANSNRTPATSSEAINWGSCSSLFDKVFIKNGLFAVSTTYTKPMQELAEVCPTSQINYESIIFILTDTGGPSLLDWILPAEQMIGRILIERWPNCSSTSERLNFPKKHLVNGRYEWVSNCTPCNEELNTITKQYQLKYNPDDYEIIEPKLEKKQ